MPCYDPRTGYRSRIVNASGKRSLVFNPSQGYRDLPVTIACGQCIGCRLERSRQWAMRCVHEASMHERNCFITLTYSPLYYPKGGTLVLSDFQNFMKRLRFRFGSGIRFFHCGEYGEKSFRPHYHALLFNFDFPDRVFSYAYRGINHYVSKSLEDLWPFGFHDIGDVTFESAAYVARYITKKKFGAMALEAYSEIDYSTGEILSERKPEYCTMSRRPGIGSTFFQQYFGDLYPKDFITLRGKRLRPPKYYDSMYELVDPQGMALIKGSRRKAAEKHADNNTIDRRMIREEIQHLKAKRLIRRYESEA